MLINVLHSSLKPTLPKEPLMRFEMMTTLNLPKLGQSQIRSYVHSISSYDTFLNQLGPQENPPIHNAMAMLAPAATAPTLRGIPSHRVPLSSFGERGVRQNAVGGWSDGWKTVGLMLVDLLESGLRTTIKEKTEKTVMSKQSDHLLILLIDLICLLMFSQVVLGCVEMIFGKVLIVVSIVMRVPLYCWMVYKCLFHGKSHLQMDDKWGYPHFRTPPYRFWLLHLRRCDCGMVQMALGC